MQWKFTASPAMCRDSFGGRPAAASMAGYNGQASSKAAAVRSAAQVGNPIHRTTCCWDRKRRKCLCHSAVPRLKVGREPSLTLQQGLSSL